MRYNSTACRGRYARQKQAHLLVWYMQTAKVHTCELQHGYVDTADEWKLTSTCKLNGNEAKVALVCLLLL